MWRQFGDRSRSCLDQAIISVFASTKPAPVARLHRFPKLKHMCSKSPRISHVDLILGQRHVIKKVIQRIRRRQDRGRQPAIHGLHAANRAVIGGAGPLRQSAAQHRHDRQGKSLGVCHWLLENKSQTQARVDIIFRAMFAGSQTPENPEPVADRRQPGQRQIAPAARTPIGKVHRLTAGQVIATGAGIFDYRAKPPRDGYRTGASSLAALALRPPAPRDMCSMQQPSPPDM